MIVYQPRSRIRLLRLAGHRPRRLGRHAPTQDGLIVSSHQQKADALRRLFYTAAKNRVTIICEVGPFPQNKQAGVNAMRVRHDSSVVWPRLLGGLGSLANDDRCAPPPQLLTSA